MQRIKALRRLWFCAVLTVAATLATFFLTSWPRLVREILLLMGVGLYMLATLRVIFARCPACGHLFHNVLGFSNPLSKACSNCGRLLEGEEPEHDN